MIYEIDEEKVDIEITQVITTYVAIHADKAVNEQVIAINMEGKSGFKIEDDLLRFSLRVTHLYESPVTELAVIETQNLFKVKNLGRFLDGTNIHMPAFVWSIIVGVSISHTRALLAQAIAGTTLRGLIMPIVDPNEVAKTFFPVRTQEEVAALSK